MQVRALAGLALLLAACGKGPVEGASKQVSAADPARIAFTMTGGMTGTVWKLELDSATASWTSSCTAGRGGFTCGRPDAKGTLPRATTDRIFIDAARPDFKALRPEYDMSATFVDGPGYGLVVVTGGATREVRWSDAARPLPTALSRVVDGLRTATGTAD